MNTIDSLTAKNYKVLLYCKLYVNNKQKPGCR